PGCRDLADTAAARNEQVARGVHSYAVGVQYRVGGRAAITETAGPATRHGNDDSVGTDSADAVASCNKKVARAVDSQAEGIHLRISGWPAVAPETDRRVSGNAMDLSVGDGY